MPKFKNSNATFWVIFKQCDVIQIQEQLFKNWILHRWTWYYQTSKCLLYDHETPLNRNITDCTCFTSTRCGGADETTPTLVGGVEPVEVLLEKGPSLGFVPDLPAERQFPVVASIGDKVFLCGGADGLLAAQSTCFYYSFVKGRWIEMEEMPKGPLSRSAGVAAYGDFYIVGGQTAEGNATQLVSPIRRRRMHGVWKSQKKSHSTLQAKRAMFTFWVDKS